MNAGTKRQALSMIRKFIILFSLMLFTSCSTVPSRDRLLQTYADARGAPANKIATTRILILSALPVLLSAAKNLLFIPFPSSLV